MMDDDLDDLQLTESDSSQVFIEYEIKPVNRLTRVECLRIKRRLELEMRNVTVSNQSKPIEIINLIDDDESEHQSAKRRKHDRIVNILPATSDLTTCTSSSSRSPSPGKKTILDYFSSSASDGPSSSSSSSVSSDNTSKVKKCTPVKNSLVNTPVKYPSSPVSKKTHMNITPKRKSLKFSQTSPSKPIHEYFIKPITIVEEHSKSPDATKLNAPTNEPTGETLLVTLSPGIITKENNFKQHSKTLKPASPAKAIKKQINDIPSSSQGSLFRSEIFKLIINEELNKQLTLKMNAIENNQTFSSLLTDFDTTVMETFLNLNDRAQYYYVTMFLRKRTWRRFNNLKETEKDMSIIEALSSNSFFDMDFKKEPLNEQLQLLQAPEVQQLSKMFNVSSDKTKKEYLINGILESAVKQRCVLELFKPDRSVSRIELLQKEVTRLLGLCFRLNESKASVFDKIIVLFSLVHNIDEESKRRQSQYKLMFDILTGTIKFIPYQKTPIVVFEIREDFDLYLDALKEKCKFEEATLSKDLITSTKVASYCHNAFKKLLLDHEYCTRAQKLPTYLMRYTAASVYGLILTNFCENAKTKKMDRNQAVNILEDLLLQNVFLTGSRGKWHELLYLEHKAQRKITPAAKALLVASRDCHVNEVCRLALQIHGQKILKMKKDSLQDDVVREALRDFVTSSTYNEPISIEINAMALAGNSQGSKCVYVQETANGRQYTSVEEQAILHYKSNGFCEGIHAEGLLVSTIFNLLFFDVIYEKSPPPGVFLSSYQEQPLDYFSRSFYHNRKSYIDQRLNDLVQWSDSDLAAQIERVFVLYNGYMCLIAWREYFSVQLFCDIIKCIGRRGLLKICERFAFEPRLARSGFPDLTLWNLKEAKVKFVEVKSPNDTLSNKQRVWLDYLRNNGIDCEVCNVKNVAGKKLF